jgi:hypothetical protein
VTSIVKIINAIPFPSKRTYHLKSILGLFLYFFLLEAYNEGKIEPFMFSSRPIGQYSVMHPMGEAFL